MEKSKKFFVVNLVFSVLLIIIFISFTQFMNINRIIGNSFTIIFAVSSLLPFINLSLLFLLRKEKRFSNLLAYVVTILSFTYPLVFLGRIGFAGFLIPLAGYVLVAIFSLYPLVFKD